MQLRLICLYFARYVQIVFAHELYGKQWAAIRLSAQRKPHKP